MMMSVVSRLLLMSTSCSGAWSMYEYSLIALMRSEMRAVLFSSSAAMRSISRRVPKRVSQIRIREKRRQFPGIRNAAPFQPALDRFLSLYACELIFVLSGLQRGANLFFALRQQAAIFRTQGRAAAGNAQALQAIAQRRSGAARRGGRIVQLVREPRRQFSQRGQFFSLLLFPRDVSNAIRQQSNEALRELGHALKKFCKLAGGKRQRANRKHGAPGHADHFHSGEWQDARDLAGASGENRTILRTILPPGAHLSFKHHQHHVRGSIFLDDNSTHLYAELSRLRDKPFQIGLGLVHKR